MRRGDIVVIQSSRWEPKPLGIVVGYHNFRKDMFDVLDLGGNIVAYGQNAIKMASPYHGTDREKKLLTKALSKLITFAVTKRG